jgi:hypothetical protein
MNSRKNDIRDPLADYPTRTEIAVLMVLAVIMTGMIILFESMTNL